MPNIGNPWNYEPFTPESEAKPPLALTWHDIAGDALREKQVQRAVDIISFEGHYVFKYVGPEDLREEGIAVDPLGLVGYNRPLTQQHEDMIEKLYWEFDESRRAGGLGSDRCLFKGYLRQMLRKR